MAIIKPAAARRVKSLILLEYPSEIDFRDFSKDSCCVFLTPESTLLIRNTEYLRCYYPEDFVSSQELETLGMEHFGKVKEFAATMDEELMLSNQKIKEEKLFFTLYHIDNFKIMFDSVVSQILILKKIIEDIAPDKIYYQYEGIPDNLDSNLFFKKESIISKLIPIIAKNLSIPAVPLKEKNEIAVAVPNKISLKMLVKLKLFKMVEILKQFLYPVLAALTSKPDFPKKHIMIFKSFPEEGDLISYGRKTGLFKIFYFDPAKIKKTERFGNEQIRLDLDSITEIKSKTKSFFLYEGIDWQPVVERRVDFFLNDIIPLAFRYYRDAYSVLKQKKIDMVLAYPYLSNALDGAAYQSIKRMHIPIATCQHGSYAVHPNECLKLRNYGLMPHSFFFTWGEGVNIFFRKEAKKYNVKQVPIGSSTLKKIHRDSKVKKNIKTIYYIPTMFRGKITYYPGGSHFLDTWYYHLMMKVIHILKNHDQFEIVLKIHPAEKSLMLLEKLIGNAKHLRLSTAHLTSIIEEADAFIVDFPSTTLLQCAATRQPVIVYTGEHCVHVDPKALQSLKKRAVCSNTTSKFLEEIKNFLMAPMSYPADVMNDEFLKLYGINNSNDDINWAKILQQIT